MASNSPPEVNAITIRTPDLMLALSNEPVGVAGILLVKGFISEEIMSKMLVVSYTPTEKATILIEAVRNQIESVPSKFSELLEILSEVACVKGVVESLRSTYQKTAGATLIILSEKDLVHLMRLLQRYSYKWNPIGLSLGFTPHELNTIFGMFKLLVGAPVSYLQELLSQWVQWPTADHPSYPTLGALCTTLRSSLVGLGSLAEEVEREMKQCATGQLDQVDNRGSHESANIASKIETLENRFDDLQTRIRNELSTKPGITAKEVLSKLTGLPLLLKKEYESLIAKRIEFHGMRKETQIDDLFIVHLNSLSSFIDYGLIEHLIQKFGSDDLRKDMRSYCSEMVVFMKETTIKQLIETDRFPGQTEIPPKFSFIEAKIGEDASKCTLEHLNKIRKRYCSEVQLSDIVCHLVVVIESNSFIVRWLVPSALVDDIVKSTRYVDQSFYQEFKITSLTLDGMWLHMSEAEFEVMWIHMSSAELIDQFQIMHKQIVLELKVQNTPKDELSQCLMNQHPNLQKDASILLSEAILTFPFLPSGFFLDFDMLSIIIYEFGSDCLRDVMMSYCKFMSGFIKQLTVQQLLDLPPVSAKHHEGFIEAECGIMEEPSGYTCDKILSIKNSICAENDLSGFMLTMSHVRKPLVGDSFFIRWLTPTRFASDLIEFANHIDSAFYVRKSIASLSVGIQWVYNQKLGLFGSKLKEKYQQSQGSPSPVEWIPSPTKKIIRLAMIQREKMQQGHIEDRFVQMTISGRIDDILHAKSPVELEHIFRNTLHGGEIILIEGAPGSGKSTLTVHICQRWGKGELFQQFTVVILVQLRDPAVQRAQTIADLLPVENAEEIVAELIDTNGRGILWVLDGWDELPPHLQKVSIFCQLIKRMLNESSLIVTSRPISSGDLHPVVSSRIEVLGFTPEEQRQYFTECLKGDTKALLEKIQENPVVQSICYLPLNAAFIVHTFKYRDQSLPNTEYEIYLSVILSCIQRHCDREGRGHDLPRELTSLDDLSRSEAVREPFQCLCELAYRGVMENKVTFSSSDLPQGSNTLSLLQAIESFFQSGKSVFYNFLHLSVQEVLSAYCLTTKLSDSEQVSQFQQLFNQPRFAAVFQFYAAITKLKSPGIRQVIDRIVEAKSKPLSVSLLRCLHEAQDPALCLYVAERLEYRLDLSETSLSPLDCLSVSFFLSSITGKKKFNTVNLAQCQIGDLGVKCLTKYLSTSSYTDLVTINLKSNDIHDEGASHVAKILHFTEHLHLDISENPIGVTGTCYLLQAVRETTLLKILILFGGTIIADLLPVENTQEIVTGLRATNRRGVLWILDDLQPHLHSIFFSPNHSSIHECSIIVTSCHTVDEIIKANSKPLLVSLLRCLHEAQDPALCLYVAERLEYRLDLSETSLSPLDCIFVFFFLSALSGKETVVDLNCCNIGDRGAKCLSKYLHVYAVEYVSKIAIDLSENKINEEGASHIAGMLYYFYFEHLYLSCNPIGDNGASMISEVVRETTTLKTLILADCGITSRGTEDLSRALAQNYSLEKLDIGCNDLQDEGISHMAKALKHNKQLKTLILYTCSITSRGAEDLSKALAQNDSLEKLNISLNHLKDKGISHVAEALKQNEQLKELWISRCGMTDKGAVSLASALTVNNSLKMLHIGGRKGALTEDGLSTIAHSLANKASFVKLIIPDYSVSGRLSREVNEARKRNGLPPIEIRAI